MYKTFGLYGGTFDPIHLGHINLALEIKEKRQLDEVWFCPAKINPHKLNDQPIASAEHRLNMLHLAIAGIPNFHVLDIEMRQDGPSFTIDTLKHLVEIENSKASPAKWTLMMGDDSLKGFFHWRNVEEIVSLVPLLIGSRKPSFDPTIYTGNSDICQAIAKGWTPTRIMEISATEIRRRLKQGLYCGHLVLKECLDYIYKNQLYFSHEQHEK